MGFDLTNDPRGRVLGEVLVERVRQDFKWGGAAHDDHHRLDDWASFLASRAGQISLLPHNDEGRAEARRLFIEVAALSIAAVESHDRITEAADAG